MNIPNQLYEAVPVTPETMPEVDEPTIFIREDGCPVWYYVDKEGFDNPDTQYGKLVSWLRPYSAEELIREVAKMAWLACQRRIDYQISHHMNKPFAPDLSTFTDNLLKEIVK